jgi:isochorismate synthase
MIKIIQQHFLIWREPYQSDFKIYHLVEEHVGSAKQVILSPFTGNWLRFRVSTSVARSAEELTSIVKPELEQLQNITSSTAGSHIKLVQHAVRTLQQTSMQKVVLARNKVIEGAYNPIELFLKFSEAYPNACVFLFHTPESGCWMGATPERLLAIENGIAKAASLAGTRPVNSTGDWREKELEEQAIVTQSIKNTFAAAGLSNIQSSPLETQQAGPVEHLFCEVSGTMPEGLSPHALAKALHPTPAVGGLPKKQALSFIANHEKLDRSFYAGYFGVTSKNEAHFYVNLRSMQLFTNGLVLYAGGGITAASNPSAEWEETERKLRTLLDVIEDQ